MHPATETAAAHVPIEMLSYHWVGGVLIGEYQCPGHVPDAVKDDRLRHVIEAIISVTNVDGTWPVDVVRVGDVLDRLGVLEEIGGAALLLNLMETWSERITRARILGEREAWARIARAACDAELAAENDLATAIDRREQARSIANEAMAALHAAPEAA